MRDIVKYTIIHNSNLSSSVDIQYSPKYMKLSV